MIETGHNLLMDLNTVTKCLIVHIQTGLLAVNFYLLLIFRKVTFYNQILRTFGRST